VLETNGIRTIDVLYRVSTRAQEREGDSLYNQRREVEDKWATPAGIKVRRRIEVAESGKGALRLAGNAFVFSKRAEYTDLIVEYQTMTATQRPDAIVIDWVDRWSRNVLEYSGLITAFRMLGIRLLAVGDGLDLTDQRNDLVTHVRAAIGQEQLRIVSEKVRESRRSRRERGKWQGGRTPDGYRTHERDCEGLAEVPHVTPDGKEHASLVRACKCSKTTLHRDPEREATIIAVWKMLEASPLSWQKMADALNDAGYRQKNGKRWHWGVLYRMGENPHYAGVLTYDKWSDDGKSMRPLDEQTLEPDNDAIPDPYISIETFRAIHARRFRAETRHRRRSSSGTTSELTRILVCPECDTPMSSFIVQSHRLNRHGNPRRSPIKKYPSMRCPRAQGRDATCSNRQRVRVAPLGEALIAKLASIATMTDDVILAALQLRKSQSSVRALERERKRLTEIVATAGAARHTITTLLAKGSLTQKEAEEDLFRHRQDRTAAESRLRDIEAELGRDHARPDLESARNVITWLRDRWTDLIVAERAEALRVLIERVTYTPNGSTTPAEVRIIAYGRAFVEPAAAQPATAKSRKKA